MNKKGNVYIYITIILSLLMIAILYVMLDAGIVDYLFPTTQNYLMNETNSRIGNITSTTITDMQTTWSYLMVVFLIGFVVWGLVEAQRNM